MKIQNFYTKITDHFVEFATWMKASSLSNKMSNIRIGWLFCKFLYHRIIHKTSLEDYVKYEFYLLNKTGRDQYINWGRRQLIVQQLNDVNDQSIFDDKAKFNERFVDYIGRAYCNVAEATLHEFQKFVSTHPKFFKKPRSGFFGIGVEQIEISPTVDIKSLYERLKTEEAICEEIIDQHSAMAAFNESSVNSIRYVTVADAKRVFVFGIAARFGRKGRIADNFHHSGIASKVDPESGILTTSGRNAKGEWFVFHPDSLHSIPGFQLPNWNKVKQLVSEIALLVPSVKYVGWDIAITENGCCVIEGNQLADPDIIQTLEQRGMWYDLLSIVDNMDSINWIP